MASIAYAVKTGLRLDSDSGTQAYIDHGYATWLAIWGYYFAATAVDIAIDNQLSENDALADLAPHSAFIDSVATLRGSELTGTVYALQGNITTGYMGGPVRLERSGFEADQFGWEAFMYGSELFYVGGNYLWSYDWFTWEGFWEIMLAGSMMDLGLQVMNLGDWWTYDIVGGYPNDAIVPTSRQAVAGGIMLPVLNVAHTEETDARHSKDQMITLINALTGH